jgi:hypothetical protein
VAKQITEDAAKKKAPPRDAEAIQRDIEATRARLGDNLAELMDRSEPKKVSEEAVGWVKNTDQGKVTVVIVGGVAVLLVVGIIRRRRRRRRVIRALERLGM